MACWSISHFRRTARAPRPRGLTQGRLGHPHRERRPRSGGRGRASAWPRRSPGGPPEHDVAQPGRPRSEEVPRAWGSDHVEALAVRPRCRPRRRRRRRRACASSRRAGEHGVDVGVEGVGDPGLRCRRASTRARPSGPRARGSHVGAGRGLRTMRRPVDVAARHSRTASGPPRSRSLPAWRIGSGTEALERQRRLGLGVHAGEPLAGASRPLHRRRVPKVVRPRQPRNRPSRPAHRVELDERTVDRAVDRATSGRGRRRRSYELHEALLSPRSARSPRALAHPPTVPVTLRCVLTTLVKKALCRGPVRDLGNARSFPAISTCGSSRTPKLSTGRTGPPVCGSGDRRRPRGLYSRRPRPAAGRVSTGTIARSPSGSAIVRDNTFGFEVVFSDETLGGIGTPTRWSSRRCSASSPISDDIDVHFKGEVVTSSRNAFAAMTAVGCWRSSRRGAAASASTSAPYNGADVGERHVLRPGRRLATGQLRRPRALRRHLPSEPRRPADTARYMWAGPGRGCPTPSPSTSATPPSGHPNPCLPLQRHRLDVHHRDNQRCWRRAGLRGVRRP